VSSIDIDAGIAAHKAWFGRLRSYLDGLTDGELSVGDVNDCKRCVLGQWLYGSGEQYNLFTHYHELIKVHQRFHEVAGQIVELHQSGQTAKAEALLETEFKFLSEQVVVLLTDLKIDGY
jgi:hypothetical protein